MRFHAISVIAGLLLAGLLAFAALAIAGPTTTAPPADTLVVGIDAEPKSLDPHATTALNDFRILVNLYEGLVRFRAGSLDVEPALARRWHVSDDGRVYTFELERGVRFHDGAVFDAAAVKFNFDRMLRDDHPYNDTGPFPLAKVYFGNVKAVRVEGAHTVRFELDQPFAPLLSNLAYPSGLIVSPRAVKRWGKDVGRHPAGTGPFRFAEWHAGSRVVLERAVAKPASTRSRRVIFRPISDPMTRVTELMSGGIDVLTEVSADNVGWFRQAPGYTVHEQVGPHLWFLILNTREPPFDDPRARRAVNLAVDRRAIVRHVLQGTASPAAGPVPAAFDWAHDPSLKPYAHDPARARELLRACGAAGSTLTFYVPKGGSGMLEPVQMATAIQADLASVGLDVRIETYEWNTYLEKVNAGLGKGVHMAEMAWMTNDPDTLPYLALRSSAHPPRGFNSGYYSNERVDALIEDARRATDRDERASAYRRMAHIVHADAPWVVVASWRQNVVAKASGEGLALQPSFFLLLQDARKAP